MQPACCVEGFFQDMKEKDLAEPSSRDAALDSARR